PRTRSRRCASPRPPGDRGASGGRSRSPRSRDGHDRVTVTIRFLGTGNAFSDGGRSHACYHLEAPGTSLLLDCGGSSLPAIKRAVDPASIQAIAISHLHGDHFGGIPYFVMDQHFGGRTAPLTCSARRRTTRSRYRRTSATRSWSRTAHSWTANG